MPFYQCITLAGTLAQEQKEEIVRDITRIHCERPTLFRDSCRFSSKR
jgi:phenylpyruvate tautomerase PptA (4-oxalocrotonate tautomerase family)